MGVGQVFGVRRERLRGRCHDVGMFDIVMAKGM
jgi:hypothetical protein